MSNGSVMQRTSGCEVLENPSVTIGSERREWRQGSAERFKWESESEHARFGTKQKFFSRALPHHPPSDCREAQDEDNQERKHELKAADWFRDARKITAHGNLLAD